MCGDPLLGFLAIGTSPNQVNRNNYEEDTKYKSFLLELVKRVALVDIVPFGVRGSRPCWSSSEASEAGRSWDRRERGWLRIRSPSEVCEVYTTVSSPALPMPILLENWGFKDSNVGNVPESPGTGEADGFEPPKRFPMKADAMMRYKMKEREEVTARMGAQ